MFRPGMLTGPPRAAQLVTGLAAMSLVLFTLTWLYMGGSIVELADPRRATTASSDETSWVLRVQQAFDKTAPRGGTADDAEADAHAASPHMGAQFGVTIEPAAEYSEFPDDLVFVSLGDWGQPGSSRERVVEQMSLVAEEIKPSFVLLLGDNFYPKGVASVDSPRFQTDFEHVFSHERFGDIPFLPLLGNHDHNGNATAQVLYSKRSRRWHMPSRYYQEYFIKERFRLIALDTASLIHGDTAQMMWLRKVLQVSEKAQDRLVVVAGHDPVWSGGEHGGSAFLQQYLVPLLVAHGVAAYICAHDHTLQHIREGGIDYLVNGVASSIPPSHLKLRLAPTDGTIYMSRTLGFMTHHFSPSEARLFTRVYQTSKYGPVLVHRVTSPDV